MALNRLRNDGRRPIVGGRFEPRPPASPEPARHSPEAKPMADGRERWRAGNRMSQKLTSFPRSDYGLHTSSLRGKASLDITGLLKAF